MSAFDEPGPNGTRRMVVVNLTREEVEAEAARAAHQALARAYWRIRHKALAYQDSDAVRSAHHRWRESQYRDADAHHALTIHDVHLSAVDSCCAEIAAELGVPEDQIEDPYPWDP